MVEGTIVGENYRGKVKWFNNQKGFGFILNSCGRGGAEDIFVHFSSISEEGYKTLKENQEVTYTLVNTDRGLQAADVRKVV